MYGGVEAFAGQFGEAETLALAHLVDPDTGEEEIDEERIARALEAASSEADSYLAARYPVPLGRSALVTGSRVDVPSILIVVVNDIARYRLTGADRLETDPVVRRYEEAVRWLTNVSKGVVDIIGQSGGEGQADGGILFNPGVREWSL